MTCITATACTTTYSGFRYDGSTYTETGLYNQNICNVNCYNDFNTLSAFDYYDSDPSSTHICLELCPTTLPNRDTTTGACVADCPSGWYSYDVSGDGDTSGYICVSNCQAETGDYYKVDVDTPVTLSANRITIDASKTGGLGIRICTLALYCNSYHPGSVTNEMFYGNPTADSCSIDCQTGFYGDKEGATYACLADCGSNANFNGLIPLATNGFNHLTCEAGCSAGGTDMYTYLGDCYSKVGCKGFNMNAVPSAIDGTDNICAAQCPGLSFSYDVNRDGGSGGYVCVLNCYTEGANNEYYGALLGGSGQTDAADDTD